MEILFKWLISTSIKGSILIGCILLLKYIWRNKLGARWHYYIWFLVVIRLLIPFAPQSSMSFFNLFAFHEHTDIITKNMVGYDPNTIIRWFEKGVK
ncbi:M56 family metallopeptidase [Crassaminicella profunda]|uniref:M56 family metallopeptidase n=1 Tax=Crassaminicella profunda TaxID=1286698 RepID=UPI001CA79184|nr:M56 family metallopeptidase [Crassaminicella profunda]QZY54800.1 M56 family metallopeptidase [Crassaminicella profunda]